MQTEFRVVSQHKSEMIDITSHVADVVRQAGNETAVCSVYVPHATAAIAINENADANLCDDVLRALDKLVPQGIWRHDRIDDNGAAHIKACFLGPGEVVPVRNGRLLLGTWQAIMLVEFDGPRERRVVVTVR